MERCHLCKGFRLVHDPECEIVKVAILLYHLRPTPDRQIDMLRAGVAPGLVADVVRDLAQLQHG